MDPFTIIIGLGGIKGIILIIASLSGGIAILSSTIYLRKKIKNEIGWSKFFAYITVLMAITFSAVYVLFLNSLSLIPIQNLAEKTITHIITISLVGILVAASIGLKIKHLLNIKEKNDELESKKNIIAKKCINAKDIAITLLEWNSENKYKADATLNNLSKTNKAFKEFKTEFSQLRKSSKEFPLEQILMLKGLCEMCILTIKKQFYLPIEEIEKSNQSMNSFIDQIKISHSKNQGLAKSVFKRVKNIGSTIKKTPAKLISKITGSQHKKKQEASLAQNCEVLILEIKTFCDNIIKFHQKINIGVKAEKKKLKAEINSHAEKIEKSYSGYKSALQDIKIAHNKGYKKANDEIIRQKKKTKELLKSIKRFDFIIALGIISAILCLLELVLLIINEFQTLQFINMLPKITIPIALIILVIIPTTLGFFINFFINSSIVEKIKELEEKTENKKDLEEPEKILNDIKKIEKCIGINIQQTISEDMSLV